MDEDVKDAQSDEDIFQECMDRLALAVEAESDNRQAGIEALIFRNGEQWEDAIANGRRLEERPVITVNHTDTICRRVENKLKQGRPRIKCHPVGEGADIDKAQLVNGLIRHIEYGSNASVAYDCAGVSAINIGWGYWRVVSEYLSPDSFDQELKIVPVRNTFTGYIDPSSILPDGSDMRWFIFSEKMKRSEYKRRYPKAENTEWRGDAAPGDQSLDWENREEIRLAEYYRITEKADVLYKLQDGRSIYKSVLPSDDVMAQMGMAIALGKDGKPIQRSTSRRQVQWFRLNGKTVVDRRDLPGQWIPVVRCEGNVVDVNGKIVRYGMVKNLMDPARMFNFWRTAQTERYALAPKAPWVAAEGQLEGHPEWDTANRKAYSVLKYKPVAGPTGELLPPPQRQMPVQPEAGMAEAAQSAERDLAAVAGMPQENPDEAQRIVSGNKYLARRQAMQDLTHFQYFDNQTLAIAQTGRILLDQIPYFYDTPRMQRIIGEDGVPQMQRINQKDQTAEAIKTDLTVGKYDVVMDAGPSYQSKREENAEAMAMLLSTPLGEPMVKMGADLIIRNMDFAGADDLADRLATTTPQGLDKAMQSLPKQAQTIVQTLMNQLQQANKLIQQQHMEIKYKTDIERGWMQTEKDKAERANQVREFDIQTKAHTSIGVAEIGAAAQLLNTNTEAAHDRAAARTLIDNAEKAGKTVQ